jgi:hypothetical protein
MAELNTPFNTLQNVVNLQHDNIISIIASKINSKHLYLYAIGLIVVIGCIVYYYYKMKNDVIQVLSNSTQETFKQHDQTSSERKTKSPTSDTKIDIAEIIKPQSKMKYKVENTVPVELQEEITPEEDMDFINIEDKLSSYESESDEEIDVAQKSENDSIKQHNLSQQDLNDINKQLQLMNKKIKTI